MARWRPDDHETPTVEAAAGFEHYYGEGTYDDGRELARRDFLLDEYEDSDAGRRAYWQAVREGRS